MNESILLIPVLLPLIAGLAVLAIRGPVRLVREVVTLVVMLANLGLAIYLFGQDLTFVHPWAGVWGGIAMEMALRVYQFSGFILLAVAGFSLLVALYSWKFMADRSHGNQYYGYMLISVAMVNGAVMADHLVVLLFFWEGLLLTLMGMIAIGTKDAWKTAIKAFIIVGVTDVCMMMGIALTGWLAHTLRMSEIAAHPLSLAGLGSIAMIFMTIGAISKAGSMPFHSWIPDAAIDAPLPFMAFLPASLEKLLGIYLLGRITLNLFALTTESWVSTLLMIIGAVTILLAVAMALVQKDYKRLLSYHAISQVGYMILGIGTAVPVGIIGGLFHMINHAMYKSCLFLSGGAVEKQAGTTDLARLGGLASKMPITFTCFIVAAAAISGVPPFNGFFSKELVYDGALERHWIFYAAALLGSFLTAASFLKLGHAAYLGKRDPANEGVKEAPMAMLLPMIVIAAGCVLFGVYNPLPLHHLIQPILGEHRLEGHDFAGLPANWMLVAATVLVLAAALVNHLVGVKRSGSGLGAADHIHHAPVLSTIYDWAARRFFDPYDIGMAIVRGLSLFLWGIDRFIDWIYDSFIVTLTTGLGWTVRLAHTGNYSLYIVWSLVGAAAIIAFLMRIL